TVSLAGQIRLFIYSKKGKRLSGGSLYLSTEAKMANDGLPVLGNAQRLPAIQMSHGRDKFSIIQDNSKGSAQFIQMEKVSINRGDHIFLLTGHRPHILAGSQLTIFSV